MRRGLSKFDQEDIYRTAISSRGARLFGVALALAAAAIVLDPDHRLTVIIGGSFAGAIYIWAWPLWAYVVRDRQLIYERWPFGTVLSLDNIATIKVRFILYFGNELVLRDRAGNQISLAIRDETYELRLAVGRQLIAVNPEMARTKVFGRGAAGALGL